MSKTNKPNITTISNRSFSISCADKAYNGLCLSILCTIVVGQMNISLDNQPKVINFCFRSKETTPTHRS